MSRPASADDIALWTRADELSEAARRAGQALRDIPGVGCGDYGLTPDAIKDSAIYRQCRRAYDLACEASRAFNRVNARVLKRRPRFWRPET